MSQKNKAQGKVKDVSQEWNPHARQPRGLLVSAWRGLKVLKWRSALSAASSSAAPAPSAAYEVCVLRPLPTECVLCAVLDGG